MYNYMKKHLVILCDGMADYENENGLTPMKEAKKPFMDMLAKYGEVGLCQTVPEGMKPGSDVANLSVIGYDPLVCYTGRSPLEALSIGIDMKDDDVSYRANLVTLSNEEDFEEKTMVDYSSGEISTAEAKELIGYLKHILDEEDRTLYAGVSYRHCLVKNNAEEGAILTPPHDITGKKIKNYLPKGKNSNELIGLTMRSYELLKNHPINLKRIAKGQNPASALWTWGEGRKPALESMQEKYTVNGAMISAVDLLKGIAIGAKMDSIDVEGATGNLHTNFDGKAQAGIEALKTHDYVYIHLEAPDECGHQGDYNGKVRSLEIIDEKIIAPLYNFLQESEWDYNILICPDHATPIVKMTHVSDPVPYLLYEKQRNVTSKIEQFNEESAKNTGVLLEKGTDLMKKLLGLY